MTTPRSMDVFSLRGSVVREYQQFATSFTKIHAADIREQVDAIYAQKRYWPEPDVGYILDTFPIVRRREESRYGENRTKWLVLELFETLPRFGTVDVAHPPRAPAPESP